MKKSIKLIALVLAVLMLLPVFAVQSSAAFYFASFQFESVSVKASGSINLTYNISITPNPEVDDEVFIDVKLYNINDVNTNLTNHFAVSDRKINIFDLPNGSYSIYIDVYVNSVKCYRQHTGFDFEVYNLTSYFNLISELLGKYGILPGIISWESNRYTEASWSAYQKAYNEMFDSEKPDTAEEFEVLINNLLNAYRGLEYRYKFLSFWYTIVDFVFYNVVIRAMELTSDTKLRYTKEELISLIIEQMYIIQ